MPYYNKQQIEKAREMDLLTYLRNYEPGELVHVSGDTFSTREHDSLKISNGKWMWWSRGFGGKTALDYLIKVRGDPFRNAMEKILGKEDSRPPVFMPKKVDPAGEANRQKPTLYDKNRRKLLLPEKSPTNIEIIRYLTSRGIDREIIESCIREGLIYESLPKHNCIFIGYDENREPAYASYRGCTRSRIMGDAAGSSKRYSFRVDRSAGIAGNDGHTLHVFESAVDLLSFATKMKILTGDWRREPMLSLGGVFSPMTTGVRGKIPAALDSMLTGRTDIREIALHLDNDFAGRNATKMITDLLKDKYHIRDEPPVKGKDMNDELRFLLPNLKKEREQYVR